MRNSMLMTLYLNMSAAYIQSNHYTLALQVLDDAEKCLGKPGSQILYRKSQAITSNMASTLDDLKRAKEYIELGLKIVPEMRLDKKAPKLLMILNLDNVGEAMSE